MQQSNRSVIERALKVLVSPTFLPAAFPPPTAEPAASGLPGVACEVQSDGVKRGWHEDTMMALVGAIELQFGRADLAIARAAHGAPATPRSFKQTVLKWGLKHSGAGRAANKEDAVRIVRLLAAHYTHGDAILGATLDAGYAAVDKNGKHHDHDMADSVLLALQDAEDDLRAGKPAPVIKIGIDPGTRNISVCVLALDALVDDRWPVFRILDWMLIDMMPDNDPMEAGLVVKVSLPLGTGGLTLSPPADVAALATGLSLKVDREEEARVRRNRKAKERRDAARAGTGGEPKKKKSRVIIISD